MNQKITLITTLLAISFLGRSLIYGQTATLPAEKDLMKIKVTKVTGLLKIFQLDRKEVVVSVGDKLPVIIPSGSRIKSLLKTAEIECVGMTIVIKEKGMIKLWAVEETKTVKIVVIKGEIETITPKGKKIISQGKTYLLHAKKGVRTSKPALKTIRITKRSGIIAVLMPDKTAKTVGLKEKLPVIPPGSTIEVVTGEINIQIGVVSLVVEKGGIVQLTIDARTGVIELNVHSKSTGLVKVTVGDKIAIMRKSQKIAIYVDEAAQKATITVLRGKVKMVTLGCTTVISEKGVVIASLIKEIIIEPEEP